MSNGDNMKYWFGIVSVRDGEYEYYQRYLSVAENEYNGQELLMQDSIDWTSTDYREVDLITMKEISKEHFNILKEYIHVNE